MKTYLIHVLNIVVFVLVQLLCRAIFSDIIGWFDLFKTAALVGIIAVPLFVLAQTLAWPDNRGKFLYYIKNGGKMLKEVLGRGK